MRTRLLIALIGIGLGLTLKWLLPPLESGPSRLHNEPAPSEKNGGGEDDPDSGGEDDPDKGAADAAGAESLVMEDALIPPIQLGGAGRRPGVMHRATFFTSLGEDFTHDDDAHFHPHGTQVCASGCAVSNHPTKTLTESEFHLRMQQYAGEPIRSEQSEGLEHLLYYGRQTRVMIDKFGVSPLDPLRATVLQDELAKTHAKIEIRVVDENGEVRSWIEPTKVPFDRRHVFDMQVSGVQPLETSGTVKRTGLNHIWTRL